jgi:hypothetical protein
VILDGAIHCTNQNNRPYFQDFPDLNNALVSKVVDSFVLSLKNCVYTSAEAINGKIYDKRLIPLAFDPLGNKVIYSYTKYDKFILIFTVNEKASIDATGENSLKIVTYGDIISSYMNNLATTIPNYVIGNQPEDIVYEVYKMHESRYELLIESTTAATKQVIDIGLSKSLKVSDLISKQSIIEKYVFN